MNNVIEKELLRKAQLRMLEILIEVDRICRKNNINYWISDGTLLGAVRHGGFIPWDDDIDISMLEDDYEKFCNIIKTELDSDKFFIANKSNDRFCVSKYLKIRDRRSTFIEDVEDDNEKYHQGIFIDIFPMSYLNKNVKKYPKLYRFIARAKDLSLKTKGNFFKRLLKGIFIILGGREWSYCIYNGFFKAKSNTNILGYKFTFHNIYKTDDIFPLKEIKFEGYNFYSPKMPDRVLTMLYGNYMNLPPENDRVWHAKAIYLDTPCYFEKHLKSKR